MLQVGSSPLYRQLADVVRQRIAKGIWDIGTQIPSLDALAAEFGVALVTVRQAVALLSQEGLVLAQRGRGTHVIGRPPVHPRVPIETSLHGLAEVYRTDPPRLQMLEEGEAMPVIGPDEGRPCARYHYIRRIHVKERQAVSVISLWLDDAIFRLSPDKFRRELIIPALLDLAGDRIAKATQTLTVSTAGPEAAQALAISENSPVAEVRRVVCDHAGAVIYACDLVYRSGYITWVVDLLSPAARPEAAPRKQRARIG